MDNKEVEIREFEMHSKNIFGCALNLSNDDVILPKGQVWKRVWILEFWSENGSVKWYFLVWNRVRVLRTGRHTSTKNSQEYLPPDSYFITLIPTLLICQMLEIFFQELNFKAWFPHDRPDRPDRPGRLGRLVQ